MYLSDLTSRGREAHMQQSIVRENTNGDAISAGCGAHTRSPTLEIEAKSGRCLRLFSAT